MPSGGVGRSYLDRPAAETVVPVPLLPELVPAGLLPLEFAVPELLLLHATAPISVAAARKAGAPRRSARPAPLRCLVEIISCLAR